MTREKEKRSVSNFQEDWVAGYLCNIWISKVVNKPQKTYCILCSKTIGWLQVGLVQWILPL